MQPFKTVLPGLFAIMIAIIACHSPESPAAPKPKRSALDTFISQEATCHGQIVKEYTNANSGDAVRDYPEPVLNARHPAIKNVSFTKCVEIQDKTTIRDGIEKAELRNGTRLIIHNGGWESYSLAFLFVFPSDAKPMSLRDWYKKSVELMTQAAGLSKADSVGRSFSEDAVNVLRRQAQSAKPAPLETLLSIHGGVIPSNAWLQRVGTVDAGHRYVEITVSTGPL